ncbi:OmpA family protein [Marinicella rhabdoformis]|uniref:OmpA family protein n=1 Tax=Marinicella rhabdoformis TaxID=2580566 RepID=UPI0012AEC1EF|nr:OmpA family protein [Marinicella rhabdoformis]
MSRIFVLSLLVLMAMPVSAAKKKNLELEALRIEYENFYQLEKYSDFAKAEKRQAKESIEALYQSSRRKPKEHAVFMARKKLSLAKMTAEKEFLNSEIVKADERLNELDLETLKTEAQVARLQADKAQLLLSLQQEEVARIEAEKQAALAAASEQIEQKQAELDTTKAYAKKQEQVASLAKQEADLAFEEIDALKRQLESLAARETNDGLVMTLGDFVFDSASANIKQGAIENFSKVIEFIDGYPSRNIRIEGHTDASGSEAFNLNLSQKRADAVRLLLINYGVKAERIEAIGMGESLPVADNNTASGKAKNRRVDIIILK